MGDVCAGSGGTSSSEFIRKTKQRDRLFKVVSV